MLSSRRALTAAVAAGTLAAGGTMPAHAQNSLVDNLRVHGYLTQGYARSSDLPILGISENGTADYRSAALQFRYAVTEKDNFVLQLSHRAMGSSVYAMGQPDIELDWAFYQRRFGPVSMRVGRAPVAAGIFNEVRDVGTILPFYRAPAAFYAEGFETLDGVSVSHTAQAKGWELETTVYGGGIEYKSVSWTRSGNTMVPRFRETYVEPAYGGQVWVGTPVRGVRVGAGAMRFSTDAFGLDNGGFMDQAGVDADLSRVYARAEARVLGIKGVYENAIRYAQTGVRITDRVSVHAQTEISKVETPLPNGTTFSYDASRDHAVGFNFAPSPGIVLKLEAHRAEGYSFDTYVSPAAAAMTTNYLIGSVSVSF